MREWAGSLEILLRCWGDGCGKVGLIIVTKVMVWFGLVSLSFGLYVRDRMRLAMPHATCKMRCEECCFGLMPFSSFLGGDIETLCDKWCEQSSLAIEHNYMLGDSVAITLSPGPGGAECSRPGHGDIKL